MFHSHEKSIGTDYTATVAWLSLAFVFGPAGLMIAQPLAYGSVLTVFAWGGLCVGFAALSWQRFSRLRMPCLSEGRGWWK